MLPSSRVQTCVCVYPCVCILCPIYKRITQTLYNAIYYLINNALQRWQYSGVKVTLHMHYPATSPHRRRGSDRTGVWLAAGSCSSWAGETWTLSSARAAQRRIWEGRTEIRSRTESSMRKLQSWKFNRFNNTFQKYYKKREDIERTEF